MSYKDTNIANPGTSTQYGADDMEQYARNFNGQVAGLPAVTIKNQNKWTFWDGIFAVRNQPDTWRTVIRGASNNAGSDLDLSLPPITTNDTFAAIGLAQTWAAKQRYNLGIVFQEQSTPGDPGVALHNLFVAANGHLQKIDHNLVVKDYDVTAQAVPIDMKDGSLATRMFDVIVTKRGTTFYAIKGDGTVLSSGTNPNTVIAAAIANTGWILLAAESDTNDWTWDLQAGFSGFNIGSFTYVVGTKTINLNVPDGYTGHVFNIIGFECGFIGNGMYINEQGTPDRNWTAVKIGTGTSADDIHNVVIDGFFALDAGKVISINQGSTGKIYQTSINRVQGTNFKVFIEWTNNSSTLIRDIVISECKPWASSGITTDIFKGVSGTRNQFYGNMAADVTGAMSEMTIASNSVNAVIFGGNHTGLTGTYTDSGTDTYIDDSIHTEFKLKGTALTPSQITSNQNDYNPTGWNEKQTILRLSSDASRNITGLIPGSNPKNRHVWIFNVGSNNIVLKDDDSGSSAANRFALSGDITLTPDSSALLYYDSTTSKWRAVASPASASLAGVALLAAANLFTETQEISKNTDAILKLTKPINTTNTEWGLEYWALDSGSAAQQYAEINAKLIDNTAGSEDGELGFYAFKNGTLTKGLALNGDGLLTPALQGAKLSNVAKTANYTMTATDYVVRCDASGGAFTITLPAAATAGAGTIYKIIRTDITGSTNLLTVDANGSETIDGMLTWKLHQAEFLVIMSDGTNWVSIAHSSQSMQGYYFDKGSTDNKRYVAGYLQSGNGLVTTTTSPANNTLWAFPFVVSKVTKFDTICCNVTTLQASQNLRMGIYYDNGNNYPGALIFDSGNVSTGSTGVKDVTITSSLQILQPGLYWLVWETSATTIQIKGLQTATGQWGILGWDSGFTSQPGMGYSVSHTFGALPDPYTAGGTPITTTGSASVPLPAVGLRAV